MGKRFAVVGDVMLGRHVDALVERRGLEWLLADVRAAADDRPLVANLESPLCDVPTAVAQGAPRFQAPTRRAAELAGAGVAVLSVANNHVLDCGVAGLSSTLEALRAAGIRATGAGLTSGEATRPAILELDGCRVGFLAFSYIQPATPTGPGVAYLYDETVATAIHAVRAAVDVLVVLPHSGIELFRYPLPRDQAVYRRMVDLGADLVVGSHPHCIQAAERHAGRWIFYAIGDCLFDHHEDEVWARFWSGRAHPRRFGLQVDRDVPRHSLMLLVDIERGTPVVQTVPLRACPRPERLSGEDYARWEAEFRQLGEQLQVSAEVQEKRRAIERDLLDTLGARGVA